MQLDKDYLRRDQFPLLESLRAAGANVDRPKMIRCPFHDDRHPSAGIYVDDEGVWRFKCHGCSINYDVYDVQARISNTTPAEILREMKRDSPPERKPLPPPAKKSEEKPRVQSLDSIRASIQGIEAEYDYTDEDGKVLLHIFRSVDAEGKKSFRQASPSGDGFIQKAPEKPWPIYRRLEIQDVDTVVVVEGEKCADALAAIGIQATTSPCGAGNAKDANWSPLAGKKVILWADNDPKDENGVCKGEAHMRQVAEMLEELNPRPSVFWVNYDQLGLPPKGDAYDFIEMYGETVEQKKSAVLSVIETADGVGPAADLARHIELIIAGKKAVVEMPWRILSQVTNAMYPGTITLLCGDPGSTKSFLLLEALYHWHCNGVPVAVYEMEDDREYHLMRLLAQAEYNSNYTNTDWIANNAEEIRDAMRRNWLFLNSLGECISDAPDKIIKLPDMLAWIRKRLALGARVIAIDPITACPVEKPWIEDKDFIFAAKALIRQYDASLILVTHPKKGAKSSSMSDLHGSAAYQQFSQTILWIKAHEKPSYENVESFNGIRKVKINRTIQVLKSRNSYGAKMNIGFHFDGGTFRSIEEGVIHDEDDEVELKLKQQSFKSSFSTNPTDF